MPEDAPAENPDSFEDPLRYQPKWSNPVFVSGILVGAVLAFAGYVGPSISSDLSSISSTFLLISGVSIIFGAFGANASYKRKGIVVGGVASIALMAFATFHYFQQKEIGILQIRGDVKDIRAELTGSSALPGAHHGNFLEFRFLPGEVEIDHLSLAITPSDDRLIEFDCIPQSALTRAFGGSKRLVWRYDSTKGVLTGVEDESKEVPAGPCLAPGETAPRFSLLDSIQPLASAHAAESIESLLYDLESEIAIVRRNARRQLTALGKQAIVPMMDHWERRSGVYRVRLGISVALTEYLRDHKNERKQISALLSENDILNIAWAAGDRDRTLRIYASEFLYDLGDPRVIAAADTVFPASDDDGRYNLVLILSGTVNDINATERAELARKLAVWRRLVGPNTQALIDKVRSQLG